MTQKPKTGEFYRHFKGNLYQVLGVAKHSETGEELVIYQALYDDYQLYARPLSSFMERLSSKGDPSLEGKERFQRIEFSEKEAPRSVLCEFLETESWEGKLEILQEHKDEMTEDILEACAESIDVVFSPSLSADQKFYQLISVLQAKERYERKRR